MRRLSHVVATVTSVALMALTTGCGGDNPTPSATPEQTPSASPSSPDNEQPPQRPSAVQERTDEGAVSAIRYFIATLNYAGRTGDTEAMRTAYVPYCQRCEAIADGIDTTYSEGGEIRGGEWLPRRFKAYPPQGRVAVVDAVVDYTPQTWRRTSKSEVESVAAQEDVLKAFNVRWRGQQGWSVSALDPDA